MRNASSYRKRNQSKRNICLIRAFFITLFFCGFSQLNAQALLLEGASKPFTLKQLVSPFAELKEVDTVVVLSERRIAVRKTGELGFRMYTSGLQIISSSMANEVREESEGYIPFRIGYKWGMVDTTGEVTVKPRYDETGPLSEGLIWVKQNAEWGFVNKQGKWMKKPFFTNPDLTGLPLQFIAGRTAFVNPDLSISYLVSDGRIIKTAHFAGGFRREELLRMQLTNFNLKGTPEQGVVDEFYDYPSFSAKKGDSILIVRKDNLWGFVKPRSGKAIANPEFADASFFDGGTAAVKTSNGWTILDTEGNTCNLQYFDSLSKSYKGVHIYTAGSGEDRWMGLVVKNCEIIVPGSYRIINEFKGNYAVGSKDGITFNYLNLTGDEVFLRQSFTNAETATGGYGVILNDGKWEVRNLADPIALPVYTSTERNSFRLIPLINACDSPKALSIQE